MTITHIVLFQFKADAAPETVKALVDGLFALKTLCLHPTTKQPYVLSIKGGKDNSPEGNQGGLTHAFVVEFATAADRDYYAKSDPAHLAYIKTLAGVVVQARVLDFQPNVPALCAYYHRQDDAAQRGEQRLATRVWALAARLYLATVVEGWPTDTSASPDVAAVLALLQSVPITAVLHTLAGPLCVAGCLASSGQRPPFTDLLAAAGALQAFGGPGTVLRILRCVWEMRDGGGMDET